ncbi:hypothetical protein NI17_005155 [Thermobifida halotolerans]|uniref:Uncharacterized protein n=1 Tax=Thermobifida halotolerans TaxID=483545 RepID=A0A399G6P4_9ACTN|nr:hypothetical protein [Thermobifida halotolerans]UOE20608.1 hypothetical protein NI17_005155 [Thermobifida halotolerans]
MTESFNRPYLNQDQIDSLEYSARVLSRMEDQTMLLHDSAVRIQSIQDYEHLLVRSADVFREFPHYIPQLVSVAEAIQSMLDNVKAIDSSTERLEIARADMNNLHDAVTSMINAGFRGLPSQVQQVEWAVDRFTSAAGSIDQLREAAGALEAASQALNVAETVKGRAGMDKELSRKIFWNGFASGIGAVIVILSLWTFLIKQGM